MSQKVTVQLVGQDQLSDDLKRIRDSVSHLDKSLSRLNSSSAKGFNNLGNSISNSLIKVNLLGAAISSAMNAAANSIGNAVAGFNELQQAQQSLIADADSLNGIINVGLGNAKALILAQRTELTQLALDYGVAANTAISAFERISDERAKVAKEQGIPIEEALKAGQQTAVNFAAVAQSQDIPIAQLNSFQDKLIAGSLTEGEMKELDVASNPKMASAIEFAKGQAGINDIAQLKDLTKAQRIAFIDTMGSYVQLSDEAKAEIDNLAKTQFDRLHAALFGKGVGLFSFTRDLENLAGEQTIGDALNDLGYNLFSPDGLFSSLGKAFSRITGIDADDLMETLYQGLVWLDEKLVAATEALDSIQNFDLKAGIVSFINNTFQSLTNLDAGSVGGQIGKFLADAANFLMDILWGLDWGLVAQALLNGAAMGLATLGSFLANLDWKAYLVAGIGALALAAALSIGGLITTALGSFTVAFGGAILAGLAGAVAAISLPIVLLVAAVVLVFVGLGKLIYDRWDEIKGHFAAFWSDLSEVFVGLGLFIRSKWDAITNALGKFWNDLSEVVVGLFTWVFDSLKDQFHQLWDVFKGPATQAFDVLKLVFDWWLDRVKGIQNFLFGKDKEEVSRLKSNNTTTNSIDAVDMSQAVRNLPTTVVDGTIQLNRPITNRADGFTSGLIKAAIEESRRAPANTSLYVGNTSEQTLTTSDQQALASRLSRPTSAGIRIGNLHIHSNAADPKQVAKDVIKQLEFMLSQQMQSTLAPTVT